MILTKSFLLRVLPPVKMQRRVLRQSQTVDNIMNEVVTAHKLFANDYRKIAEFFRDTTVLHTARNIFNFLKENVVYAVEREDDQTTKSPARILFDGKGDCKHLAGFAGGILSALGYKYFYRFASYSKTDPIPSHVFVIAIDENGREIWIDPVLNELNKRYPLPSFYEDVQLNKNKMLSRLSGVVGVTTLTDSGNQIQIENQMPTDPIINQLPRTDSGVTVANPNKIKWLVYVVGALILYKFLKK